LVQADFRFLPTGQALGADNDPYTAPSLRQYLLDIIGAPHPGVNFIPNGAALPAGASEIFAVRASSATLATGLIFWNNARTANSTGRMDMQAGLCTQLPAPIVSPSACFRPASEGWDLEVGWEVARGASSSLFQLYRVDAAHPQQLVEVAGSPFSPDANGRVRFSEQRPAGSVLGYRIQPVDRGGLPVSGPAAVDVQQCAPTLGPNSSSATLWTLLGLAVIAALLVRRSRGLSPRITERRN